MTTGSTALRLLVTAALAASACGPSVEEQAKRSCIKGNLRGCLEYRQKKEADLVAMCDQRVGAACAELAEHKLAERYVETAYHTPPDRPAAMQLFHKACDAGNGYACRRLVELGEGTFDEATLTRACKADDPPSCFMEAMNLVLEKKPQEAVMLAKGACESTRSRRHYRDPLGDDPAPCALLHCFGFIDADINASVKGMAASCITADTLYRLRGAPSGARAQGRLYDLMTPELKQAAPPIDDLPPGDAWYCGGRSVSSQYSGSGAIQFRSNEAQGCYRAKDQCEGAFGGQNSQHNTTATTDTSIVSGCGEAQRLAWCYMQGKAFVCLEDRATCEEAAQRHGSACFAAGPK